MEINLKKLGLSIQEALKISKPYDVLILEDKVYVEKVEISIPHLTMIGTGHTRISYHLSNGTLIPGTTETYGTTGSATVIVRKEAFGFHASGIIFENTFDRLGKKNGQAVAFKSECSELYLKNCSFVGFQDTLYVDFGKNNLIEDCEIYGDVDFIFGSADCVFRNCHIYAKATKGECAYYTAPSTYVSNKEGFVFKQCVFHKEDIETYLGRPWFPGLAKEEVFPRIRFIDCVIPADVHLYLKQMHPGDSSRYFFQIENCLIEEGK